MKISVDERDIKTILEYFGDAKPKILVTELERLNKTVESAEQKRDTRKQATKQRKPLKPVSKKQAAKNAERSKILPSIYERDGHCQGPTRGLTGQCWGPLDPHEIKTRGRRGSITNPDNIIILCRAHHTWVTEHPIEARKLGLVVNSWDPEPGAET